MDHWSSPYGSVTLHPTLIADIEEHIMAQIEGDAFTIETLGMEESVGAVETVETVSADTLVSADRYSLKGPKLPDGRILHWNVRTRGVATFEDGSSVEFQLWAYPAPSRSGKTCEIKGVAIQPSGFGFA